MATQNSGHPPTLFSISTPFQSVRLVEMPDDLVGIVTSRPSGLKFKSAPPKSKSASTSGPGSGLGSTASTSHGTQEGVLHLCAGDKAWAVKQVSTSNSVYLIRPTAPPGVEDGDGGDDVEMRDSDALKAASRGAVTAVAQVGNFLELHPVKLDEGMVEQAVVDLLPVWHPVRAQEDVDLDLQASNDAKGSVSLGRLIDDVAAPDDVVLRVCARLGVVDESGSAGLGRTEPRCVIPSTRVLLDVWSDLIEACAVEGVKLDREISVVRMVNMLVDEVSSTIVEKMFEEGGMFDRLGLFETEARKLKAVEVCRFVAGLILTSERQSQMEVQQFMNRWTDLVPSSFVKLCTMESLTSSLTPVMFAVSVEASGEEVVRWIGQVYGKDVVLAPMLTAAAAAAPGQGVVTTGAAQGEASGKPPTASAAADKKRKWHEKFGAQRNLKR